MEIWPLRFEAPNREKRESGIRMEVRNRSKLTHKDGSRGEERKQSGKWNNEIKNLTKKTHYYQPLHIVAKTLYQITKCNQTFTANNIYLFTNIYH
jgi:hypothetical protein